MTSGERRRRRTAKTRRKARIRARVKAVKARLAPPTPSPFSPRGFAIPSAPLTYDELSKFNDLMRTMQHDYNRVFEYQTLTDDDEARTPA